MRVIRWVVPVLKQSQYRIIYSTVGNFHFSRHFLFSYWQKRCIVVMPQDKPLNCVCRDNLADLNGPIHDSTRPKLSRRSSCLPASLVFGLWLYFWLWGFVLIPSTTRFFPFSWAVVWRWLSRPMVRSVTAALTPVSIQPVCGLFPQELHYLGFVLVKIEPWCEPSAFLLHRFLC